MNTAPKNQTEIQSWDEVDQLINQLRAWGIEYLVGLDHSTSPFIIKKDQKAAITLIQHLAQCELYPRVRDAIISLLLLHPELADAVLIALKESEPEVAEQIAVLTLATLYLQRLWSVRLTLALGHKPGFPEGQFAFLWEKWHLPPPACHYGQWGLTALQEYEQRRTGLPFTFIGNWQNQVDHLLWQEEIKQRTQQPSVVATIMRDVADEHQCEEESEMSMRPSVDRAAIALGKIERGNSRDIADVKLLVQKGIIKLDELDVVYQQVLAQLGQGRYPRLTPDRFAQRYAAVRQLL